MARPIVDLVGKKFGDITVLGYVGLKRDPHENQNFPVWKCLCLCGKEFNIEGRYLKSRKSKSCGSYGCSNGKFFGEKGTLKDLTGQKFNSWTVEKFSKIKTLPKSKQTKTYWFCKCKCGEVKEIYANSLVSGKSKACGKKYCRTNTRLPGEAAKHNLFTSYTSKCKRKNIKFELTEEEFNELTQKNCFYCDKPPSCKHGNYRFNGECVYNGLDKVKNDLGYTLDNVVPACKNCNLAKRLLSVEEFFSMVRKIYERHLKNEKA